MREGSCFFSSSADIKLHLVVYSIHSFVIVGKTFFADSEITLLKNNVLMFSVSVFNA